MEENDVLHDGDTFLPHTTCRYQPPPRSKHCDRTVKDRLQSRCDLRNQWLLYTIGQGVTDENASGYS